MAWLLFAAPAEVVFTLAGLVVAPSVDPVPALAVLPAVLGAGAAVPVWVGLLRVRPVDDPRRPTAAGRGATWAATERLTRRGAEVLAAAGPTTAAPTAQIPLTWDAEWVRTHRVTVWALGLLTVGWIPVIPQGLMVLVFDIQGGWIVASHLAGATRTATALGMVAVGGGLPVTGLVLSDRREPA